MIKFFRNFRKNLLNEDKTTKYFKYAIGEIVLVVIGILIALQINNWNENRKLRKEEKQILTILKTEYLYNRLELNRSIGKAERMYQRSDSLLNMYQEEINEYDEIKLKRLIRSLISYPTFDPSNGALNDLIGSGRLNIIQNELLRLRLSQWFGMLQDVKEDEQRLMGFGDEYIIPLQLDLLTLNKKSKFSNEASKIFKSKRIENMITRINLSANYLLDPNYKMLEKEIDEILAIIEKELKNKE
jgi:hypothetical protein